MDSLKIELNGKVICFRLTGKADMELEEKVKMSVIDYIQNETATMCITLLQYMRMFENEKVTLEESQNLFDEFINAGWTIKRIIQDIIYETLVVSGFLEKKEWEEIKNKTKQIQEKMLKKSIEVLENI